MTARVLHLFPDTNLFIQCRSLEELDWSAWKEFDHVHLMVTRPVQREIDNQKNRGSDRVGNRARATSSLFRAIIIGDEGFRLIRKEGPEVKLLIDPSCIPSSDLADRLDLSEPDDALVGCVHFYRASNPSADARVLTHDTGPMATAKMLGVPFVAIPDDWCLSPENIGPERKLARLENEITRLKKAEPEFEFTCVDADGNELSRIEFDYTVFQPLRPDEVSELVGTLRQHFPIATEFGSREPAERDIQTKWRPLQGIAIPGRKEIYVPATDEAIARYTDTAYPNWLEKCERFLARIHEELQRDAGLPAFCFTASNVGTRPGNDVLVTIEAKGNFLIRVPEDMDEDYEAEDSVPKRLVEFPIPPEPPIGEWVLGFGPNPATAFSVLARQAALLGKIGRYNPVGPKLRFAEIHRNLAQVTARRDPNGFFWKPNRPMSPVDVFNFECEQWRHGVESKPFYGTFFINENTDVIAGALECRIHAGNLSGIVRKTVPTKIKIRHENSRQRAEKLVCDLIKCSK